MNKNNLAGIVILYKPSSEVYGNIISYSHRLDKLYIVDNTPENVSTVTLDIESQLSNTSVIRSSSNIGISKALNIALKQAKADGFKWLMSMDQDTSFDRKNLDLFLECFRDMAAPDSIIYAPLHNKKLLIESLTICPHEKVEFVMTSANIIEVNLALKIGGFDENLFIDDVDHEFCFRAQDNGYVVTQFSNCFVTHQLGDALVVGERTHKVYSPERLYFMIRNFFYIKKKYKKTHAEFFRKRSKYLLIFFSQQIRFSSCRAKMILMLIKGIADYNLKRYGKGGLDV